MSGINDAEMLEEIARKMGKTSYSLDVAVATAKMVEQRRAQLQIFEGKDKTFQSVYKGRGCAKSRSRQNPQDRSPSTTPQQQKCLYCGKYCIKGNCPAFGKVCHKCGHKNHFSSMCGKKKGKSENQYNPSLKQKQANQKHQKVHDIQQASFSDWASDNDAECNSITTKEADLEVNSVHQALFIHVKLPSSKKILQA